MNTYGYIAKDKASGETSALYFLPTDERAAEFFGRSYGSDLFRVEVYRVGLFNPDTLTGEFFEPVLMDADWFKSASEFYLKENRQFANVILQWFSANGTKEDANAVVRLLNSVLEGGHDDGAE